MTASLCLAGFSPDIEQVLPSGIYGRREGSRCPFVLWGFAGSRKRMSQNGCMRSQPAAGSAHLDRNIRPQIRTIAAIDK
jgi:hypothetical protein